MRAYLKLSDTVPNPSSHTAPGFRLPGEYKWSAEHCDHILDGRVFNLEHEPDRIDFNEACMNHLRVQHRWHFPVVVILKKVVESGFDEPETVTITQPLADFVQTIEAEAAAVPTPPEPPVPAAPPTPVGPPTTPNARKRAQALGVDMETLRGMGTGTGGMITVEDVVNQWRRDGGDPGAPPAPAGQVRMDELLAVETP